MKGRGGKNQNNVRIGVNNFNSFLAAHNVYKKHYACSVFYFVRFCHFWDASSDSSACVFRYGKPA